MFSRVTLHLDGQDPVTASGEYVDSLLSRRGVSDPLDTPALTD
jgi:hypothetical protein